MAVQDLRMVLKTLCFYRCFFQVEKILEILIMVVRNKLQKVFDTINWRVWYTTIQDSLWTGL